jgi:hypothetical protein
MKARSGFSAAPNAAIPGGNTIKPVTIYNLFYLIVEKYAGCSPRKNWDCVQKTLQFA